MAQVNASKPVRMAHYKLLMAKLSLIMTDVIWMGYVSRPVHTTRSSLPRRVKQRASDQLSVISDLQVYYPSVSMSASTTKRLILRVVVFGNSSLRKVKRLTRL